MSQDATVTLMAIVAVLMGVTGLGLLIASRFKPRGEGRLIALTSRLALPAAAVVALLATASSLWLSEVADFVPCQLCWYQRIAMYPMAIVLPIAAIRRDLGARWYALPLAVVGALIALFHHIEQRLPTDELLSCSADGNPCTTRWVNEFGGMVSIPTMAFGAFVLLTGLLVISGRATRS